MSSLVLYQREAAACQRAAERAEDPVLAGQLWQEQALWLGLAGVSAAIENLTASMSRLTASEDALELAASR